MRWKERMPASFLSFASCNSCECPSGHGAPDKRLQSSGCVCLCSSSLVKGFGFQMAIPEICGNAPVPWRHQDSALKAVCLSQNTAHISSTQDGLHVPFHFVCGQWEPVTALHFPAFWNSHRAQRVPPDSTLGYF